MFYVYMLTNRNDKVLYTGVTKNLERRAYEHKHKPAEGFTSRYSINKLVYFEHTESNYAAISREKEIKGWTRLKKNRLVESMNPDWKDLSEGWG